MYPRIGYKRLSNTTQSKEVIAEWSLTLLPTRGDFVEFGLCGFLIVLGCRLTWQRGRDSCHLVRVVEHQTRVGGEVERVVVEVMDKLNLVAVVFQVTTNGKAWAFVAAH